MMAFFIVPVIWFALGTKSHDFALTCWAGAFVLSVAIIGCLISAAEQYGYAKDAERDAILEKLEEINKGIADLNKKFEEP